MTTIYSFLQKKKMREFNHGMYMVIAAYVLSFLLLIVGSDTLYNIKSKADGLNKQSDEVNKIEATNDNEGSIASQKSIEGISDSNQIEYHRVEYRMDYMKKYLQKYQEATTVYDDTNWLLGFGMNDEEYEQLVSYMQENEALFESNDNTITSFSATGLTAGDISKEESSLKKVSLTKDEIKMLEQIVEAEATGEDIIGKILVANVIFNRIEDEEFPDNVKEVIFQKVGDDYQFSPISDKRFWSVKVTKETKEAVQRAIDGEDYSEGAIYFMARRLARKSSVKWFDNNLHWLFKHGGHEFYK